MKITKKIFTGFIFTLILAASAHAAGKWETLIFPEDINMGLIELDRYCLLHDISVADVKQHRFIGRHSSWNVNLSSSKSG